MSEFTLMIASVTALVGGGLFAWREQNPRRCPYADHQQAICILSFVAAMLLASCLGDLTKF
jgi:hypothetical protein